MFLEVNVIKALKVKILLDAYNNQQGILYIAGPKYAIQWNDKT